MSASIIVQRRFPVYEFLLTSRSSPAEASRLLREFFARNEDRFAVAESSAAEAVTGPTFAFRNRPARFWSFAPAGRIYAAPSGGGSNIHVQLRVPQLWLTTTWILVFATMFSAAWSMQLGEWLPSTWLTAVATVVVLSAIAIANGRIAGLVTTLINGA